MSGFRLDDTEDNGEPTPDLAQHSEFHFKDREVEEAIQRAKQEKLAREEAEWEARRAEEARRKSTVEIDATFEAFDDGVAKPVRRDELPEAFAPQPPIQAPPQAAAASTAPVVTTSSNPPAPKVPTPKIALPPIDMGAAQAATQAPAKPQAAAPVAPAAPRPAAKVPAVVNTVPTARTAAANIPAPKTVVEAPVLPEITAEDMVGRSSFSLRPWLDKTDPIAMVISQIAAVAGVLALGYILWGIFGGQIGDPKAPRAAQSAQNIALAAQVFRWAAIALAISSISLMLDVAALGPALVIGGMALHFGATPLFASVGNSRATLFLIENARSLGWTLLLLGIFKSTIDVARWAIERPNRLRAQAVVGRGAKLEKKQQNIAANSTMFSPCWNLPFCREVVRVKCPAFLARTRCWKFGRGCLCDQELVQRAINNAPVEVIKSPTEMSRRKAPCGQCAIFLEHQSLKYKMISPVAIPMTIIAAVMGWPYYEKLWTLGTKGLTGLWQNLSFSATKVATTKATPSDMDQYDIPPEQIAQWGMNMIGVLLAFMLLIYISKFIEWAILKQKW
ncbi:MAG TPA: hypothetical protein VF681_12715 [Abditibacteriaceae bacterium]|jgi:hypothetical protein